MTISYTGKFSWLLTRWRGSLYRTVWKQLAVFLFFHYMIRFCYHWAMSDEERRIFESIVLYVDDMAGHIPVTFVLGFYIDLIVRRWFAQFEKLAITEPLSVQVCGIIRSSDHYHDAVKKLKQRNGMTESTMSLNKSKEWMSIPLLMRSLSEQMLEITALLPGNSERMRMIRRTVMRYCNLTSVLAWRSISSRVLKRFPTTMHCVTAGLMTKYEHDLYENIDGPYGKYFAPLVWTANILGDLKTEGLLSDSTLYQLMQELEKYRAGFGAIMCYNWVSIPLVYTQLVTVFVYGYFCLCLVGRHFLDPKMGYDGHAIDYWFPFFTVMQFLMYMGWLRVGEDLTDPFGEDDDDFELNHILDRNVQASYFMVDSLAKAHPPVRKDPNWGVTNPFIPNTKASLDIGENVFSGHLVNFTKSLKKKDMELVYPGESIQEQAAENHSRSRVKWRRRNAHQDPKPGDDYVNRGKRSQVDSTTPLFKESDYEKRLKGLSV